MFVDCEEAEEEVAGGVAGGGVVGGGGAAVVEVVGASPVEKERRKCSPTDSLKVKVVFLSALMVVFAVLFAATFINGRIIHYERPVLPPIKIPTLLPCFESFQNCTQVAPAPSPPSPQPMPAQQPPLNNSTDYYYKAMV